MLTGKLSLDSTKCLSVSLKKPLHQQPICAAHLGHTPAGYCKLLDVINGWVQVLLVFCSRLPALILSLKGVACEEAADKVSQPEMHQHFIGSTSSTASD